MENNKSPIVNIIKKTLPAVVSIVMEKHLNALISPFNSFGDGYPQKSKKATQIGGGTGFIINKDGTILTNRHVVEDKTADYVVILQNNRKLKPKILARDPIHDIAILKINPGEALQSPLPTIKIREDENIELGEQVIAIGNALGLFRNTISTGIVSGLSREIEAKSEMSRGKTKLRGLIQTDAAINPGNSGGPLINLSGEAIGINAAMIFGAENIGFAMPISNAIKTLKELKQYGRIRIPYLGVRYIQVDKSLQKQFNLPVSFGALVMSEPSIPNGARQAVVPNSPAHKAGIKEADIILSANNEKITKEQTISDILFKYKVGQKIKIKILRHGKEKTFSLILKEKNEI